MLLSFSFAMKSNILKVSRNYDADILGGSSSAYYKFSSIIYSMVSHKGPYIKESNKVFFRSISYDVIHESLYKIIEQ